MINIKELYILNSVLDKRNFFSMPSLESIKLPPLLAESVYASLIEKGILLDAESFTEEGVRLVKRMADYKDAKKYVKIGSLVMGLYKDEEGIALIQNPLHGVYDFKRVSTKLNMEEMAKRYPFLLMEREKTDRQPQRITYNELREKYSFKLDNTIFLSTFDMVKARVDRKAATTNEVLFFNEDAHYRYDRDQQILYVSSAAEAQEILEERMVLQ